MQTLKTAAIVVLLMTIMYGAYVSLTTPPEPLPEDVQEMLVINEEGSLAIDVGLPESLNDLDFSSDAPLSFGDSSSTTGSEPESAGLLTSGSEVASVDLPADVSLAEDSYEIHTDSSGVSAALNDQGISRSLSDSDLAASVDVPAPGPSMDAVASSPAEPERSYPRTTNTFELPDPNSVAADFDRKDSIDFVGGAELPSNLALTSGTSESQPPSASELLPSTPTAQPGFPGSKNLGLANAIQTADAQYADDKRKDALATLSLFYNAPNLSGEERSALLSRLDPLAREVIYSTRHLLEQPYRVGQSETLMDVAARYEVPWQLLANINQIKDPVTILPGTELKVVRGPFRAEVSLSHKELTLFLGDLYAGRFPIGIGNDPPPKPGTFTVQDKQTNRTYYDASGSPVPAGSRDNPYGEVWLDLGGQLCIHGSPSTTSPSEQGCISLAADYADDLYGILSQGSSVTIRR